MNQIYKIPVKYCPRCNQIFLNTDSRRCLFCGNRGKTPPLPPRHQYRDIESFISLRGNYYERDLPIDLYERQEWQ